MSYLRLRERIWKVNQDLAKSGLVALTWGNASGVDRETGVMAIKPSGVAYDRLRREDVVLLSLESGEVIEGRLRPSSDSPTHLFLYRSFPQIGGVIHTHSRFATSFAQALKEIPCLGTTHADHFYGTIPLTRQLTSQEVQADYEFQTGKVIAECFQKRGLQPEQVPGALVAGHGPFAWGPDPEAALENAIVMEEVAQLTFFTLTLNPDAKNLPKPILDKHFLRKHGPGAYYGQKASAVEPEIK